MRVLYVVFIFLFIFSSCKKKDISSSKKERIDFSYAGLEEGKYVDYKVDSIFYDDFFQPVKIDTFHFYRRMKVGGKVVLNDGSEAFKWYKYHSENAVDWTLTDVWVIRIKDNFLEVMEENRWFSRIHFPIKENGEWDGNRLNEMSRQYYKIRSIGPQYIDGEVIENALHVVHFDDEEKVIVARDIDESLYVESIGLVALKSIHVNKKYNSSIGLWEVSSGFDFKMEMIASGG